MTFLEFVSTTAFWILTLSGFLVGAFAIEQYESMRQKYSAIYVTVSSISWLAGWIIMLLNVYWFYDNVGWKFALFGFLIYWAGRPLGRLTWAMAHSSNLVLRIMVLIVLVFLQVTPH